MIKPKEFDDAIIDSIVDMYKSDVKISTIGKQMRMSDANIKRCLTKRNVTLKGNKFALLKHKHLDNILNKDYVIEKYNELYTIQGLASHFECGVDTIQSVFKLHDIASREFHEVRELKLQDVRELPVSDENIIHAYVTDLLSIKQIENKFRISHPRIYEILNRNNISRENILLNDITGNKQILFDKNRLKEVRDSFSNMKDAATFIGCDPTVIQRRLAAFGLPKFSKAESRINYMISDIETKLPDYKVKEYDNLQFILTHKICNKDFELGHCSVNSYKNNTRDSSRLCPHCFHRKSSSIPEKQIRDLLDIWGISYTTNNRSILGNRELDVYIESKQLAIEYCGLYWHSDLFKDKLYHLDKLDKCKTKGIRLITIFEDEWINHPEIVKSKLAHILGMSKERVFARKCKIINLDSKRRNEFLENYHIQGKDKASYSYGLTYENKLIAVASFSKLNIAKGKIHKNNVYELSRYATAINVVGGLGKLLKHFEREIKPSELITYADKRWSMGNLYSTLGFIPLADSKPNYWYMNKQLQYRLHRFNFRKSILKAKYPDIYSDDLTEMEITNKLGIRHIWDCGNMKFIKEYK